MNWPTTPARFVLTEVDERGLRDGEDGELLSVSEYRGVIPRSTSASQQAASEDTSHYKRCEPGQLVLNRLWAFRGGLGVSPHTGLVSPDYAVFDIDSRMDPRFVHYQTRSAWFVAEMTKRLRGIGTPDASNGRAPRINTDDLGRIDMFTPSLDVQRCIADMLDYEIDRIDAIVRKNRQVLKVLDSRWTRAVEDAVTIFDEVPLQYAVYCNERTLDESHHPDGIIHYIDIGAVGQGRFVSEPETLRFADAPSRARRIVHTGDTLVSTVRTYLKAIVAVPSEYDGYIASTGFAVLVPTHAVVPDYLAIACSSETFAHRVAARSRGVSYPAINPSDLLQLPIPLPSPDVQERVVAELRALDERQHRLRRAVESQTSVLEVRRQSLITAAVTGQLDI